MALLAACHPDSEPGACLREKDNACVEYDRDTATAGKSKCVGFSWTNACPAENRLGSCVREAGKVVETMYAGAPNHYTAAIAKQTCEGSGGAFR